MLVFGYHRLLDAEGLAEEEAFFRGTYRRDFVDIL
jgi:hypothetical protein